jgi:hypothetical protein
MAYANGVTTFYGYNDQRGWLTGVTHANSVTTLQALTYTRAATGRINAVANAGNTAESWAYSYDDLDRLTLADNTGNNTLDQSFQYDVLGYVRLRALGRQHDVQQRRRHLHLSAGVVAPAARAAHRRLEDVHWSLPRRRPGTPTATRCRTAPAPSLMTATTARSRSAASRMSTARTRRG